MGEFFKGWRRKIGVVTLLMALVLMIGWVRSHTIQDELLIRIGNRFEYSFRSSPYGLQWSGRRSNGFQPPTDGSEGIKYEIWRFIALDQYPNLFWFEREWQWDFFGFHFGEGTNPVLPRYREHYWMVPYWSITIPLTLLSCWLLLSKPPKLRSKKITELIPESVA